MISDIGTQPRGLWDELCVLKRAVKDSWPHGHSQVLRKTFAGHSLIKTALAVPEDIYRYTRIFLLVISCLVGQSVGSCTITRRCKYWINRDVIDLAAHSLENTVYQFGCLHPRIGLVLNVTYRLSIRALHIPNYVRYRTIGYSKVESGRAFPIDLHAVRLVARARIQRIYTYALIVFRTVKNVTRALCGRDVPDAHWHPLVQHVGDLLHHKLDVARCELLMCSPSVSQHVLFGLMRLSERLFAELQNNLL